MNLISPLVLIASIFIISDTLANDMMLTNATVYGFDNADTIVVTDGNIEEDLAIARSSYCF